MSSSVVSSLPPTYQLPQQVKATQSYGAQNSAQPAQPAATDSSWSSSNCTTGMGAGVNIQA